MTTEYQIGFMAIGVGILVGFDNKFAGKGIDSMFGIIGASFALFGCLLGNLFTIVGFAANAEGFSYLEMLLH
ncbi:MAG: hypothetical protein ACI94Y_003353 [Maribacter sp.]|jgi:hypothetical protein